MCQSLSAKLFSLAEVAPFNKIEFRINISLTLKETAVQTSILWKMLSPVLL